MTTTEFILKLNDKLSVLPEEEIQDRLSFYLEMISDLIEDGLTEEQAIAKIGAPDKVAEEIISEIPLAKLVKEKIKRAPKKRMSGWAITLIAVGSPIWLSLIVCAFAVLVSLYASLWSVIASLWACFGAIAGASLSAILAGTMFAVFDNAYFGIATIGAGVFLSGLSILAFFGCRIATKGAFLLTKFILRSIKKCFIKKEARSK